MGSSSGSGYQAEVRRFGRRQVEVEVVNGNPSLYTVVPYGWSPSPEYSPVTRKKGSSAGGGGGRGRSRSSSSSLTWCFNDPEMKRKRRVAGYKVYSVEGKFKASFRKGIKWIKKKCSRLFHG